jgi:hypothetical protein
MWKALAMGAVLLAHGAAIAQAPKEHETLDVATLRAMVERGRLSVVAVEPGNIMVSDGKGFPARLSLAACGRDGACRVVRIYTRYVIGDNAKAAAAVQEHSKNFTSATIMLVMSQDVPAVEVGRDASLAGGRTEGEVLGEIATAMSDARLLRDALIAADPFLKATLGRF